MMVDERMVKVAQNRSMTAKKRPGHHIFHRSEHRGGAFHMDKLDPEQLERLERAFHFFDKDGSGAISQEEAMGVFQLMGHNPTHVEVMQLLTMFDANNDGSLDLQEFAHLWWAREKEKAEAKFDEEIELTFMALAAPSKKYMTVDNFKSKMMLLGEQLEEAEVVAMLSSMKTSQNHVEGMISLEEFRSLPLWGK